MVTKRVWKIEAWIHPEYGGDDYCRVYTIDTTGYSNTVKDIARVTRNLLEEAGSAILDDFTIRLNGRIVPRKFY